MSDDAASDAASKRAAEQARLRKERREAKIRSGGSARLNRITGLGGGLQRDDVPIPPAASPAEAPAPKVHADPEEVDISQHYYEPRPAARPAEHPAAPDDLRRLMLGLERPSPSPAGTPQPPNPQADPMAALMTQLLPGGAPGSSPFPMPPGAPPFGQSPAQKQPAQSSIWRILHALFALSLGLYVALSTPFAGTLAERDAPVSAADSPRNLNFFYIFASAEAILLTTRFLLDGGKYAPSGLLGTVLGFLPAQTAGYIRVVLRYGQIFATVRSDLLVCVFVLGVAGLWRSVGVA